MIAYPSQLLQIIAFLVDKSGSSIVKLEEMSGKTIPIGCCFPPKFANSETLYLNGLILNRTQIQNSQLSNAICAQILSTELQDQHQPIYWVPVNGSSMIVTSFEKLWSRYCSRKFGVRISAPSEIQSFTLPIAERDST